MMYTTEVIQRKLMAFSMQTYAHESSTPMNTVYLNIRKAVDSVPHKELLTKL